MIYIHATSLYAVMSAKIWTILKPQARLKLYVATAMACYDIHSKKVSVNQ